MSNENETEQGATSKTATSTTPGTPAGVNRVTTQPGATATRKWFDLQPRYLVNAGVFTVIYILACWAVMVFSLLGAGASLIGITISLLIAGPIIMLYLVRTPTVGALTIMGLITGLIIGLAHAWPAIPICLVAGLLADVIAASGDFRSRGRNILAYAVFSLWYISPYVKIFYDPDGYFAHMRSGKRTAEFVDQFQAIFTPTNLIFMEVGIFVVALVGGWLGTRILSKHFAKAGLA